MKVDLYRFNDLAYHVLFNNTCTIHFRYIQYFICFKSLTWSILCLFLVYNYHHCNKLFIVTCLLCNYFFFYINYLLLVFLIFDTNHMIPYVTFIYPNSFYFVLLWLGLFIITKIHFIHSYLLYIVFDPNTFIFLCCSSWLAWNDYIIHTPIFVILNIITLYSFLITVLVSLFINLLFIIKIFYICLLFIYGNLFYFVILWLRLFVITILHVLLFFDIFITAHLSQVVHLSLFQELACSILLQLMKIYLHLICYY